MKKPKAVVLIVLAVLLGLWLVPLARCEILTLRYASDDLLPLCNAYCSSMVDELDTLKILEYDGRAFCRAYVKNNTSGHIFELKYDPGRADGSGWYVTKWDTRWAQGGGADEFVWPYVFDTIVYAWFAGFPA